MSLQDSHLIQSPSAMTTLRAGAPASSFLLLNQAMIIYQGTGTRASPRPCPAALSFVASSLDASPVYRVLERRLHRGDEAPDLADEPGRPRVLLDQAYHRGADNHAIGVRRDRAHVLGRGDAEANADRSRRDQPERAQLCEQFGRERIAHPGHARQRDDVDEAAAPLR